MSNDELGIKNEPTVQINQNASFKTEKELTEKLQEWLRLSKIHGFDRLVISRNLKLKLI